MFKRKDISVLAWMILLLILTVPILNIVFVVWTLLSSRVNKTVKNFFVAFLVFYVLAWAFGMFSGITDTLLGLFG